MSNYNCPINAVKVGKLPIANYNCIFISKLLQSGRNMVAFCSIVQNFHCLFCAACLAVNRFKNRFCIAYQEKEKYIYIYISSSWRNETSCSWFSRTQNLKMDKAIIRIKTKFVQDNESLSYQESTVFINFQIFLLKFK